MEIGLFPLGIVLLPTEQVPLHIFEPRYRELIAECLEGEQPFSAADVVDPSSGEVLLEANEELSARVLAMAQEKGIERIDIFFPEKDEVGPVLSATLRKDPIRTHEEALIEIYRRLRPGDQSAAEDQHRQHEAEHDQQ